MPRAGTELVWHPTELRLRTPIRLLLATGILVGGVLVARQLVAGVYPRLALPGRQVVSVLLQLLPGALVVLVAVGIDRRSLADFGWDVDHPWLPDLLFGGLLGAVLITAILFATVAGGWVAVQGTPLDRQLLSRVGADFLYFLAFFAATAVSEEVVARGYLLTNIAEALAGYVPRGVAIGAAVVVSSQLFGVVHALNPNATPLGVAGVSAAGVLLAVGYVYTRCLALPIGLHLAWNLFQGPVYGFPVSGFALGTSLVDTADRGPAAVTGGAFGLEAGVFSLGAVLVGVVAIVGYVRWYHGIRRVPADLTVPQLR